MQFANLVKQAPRLPFDGPQGLLMAKFAKLRACSHIAHQMQTQRRAKSGNILLEGSCLIICMYVSHVSL